VYPLPLPPAAESVSAPRGGTLAVAGEIATPAVTPTARVATFPSESTTWTTSETSPVAPAA
jgi:hypothetical protein